MKKTYQNPTTTIVNIGLSSMIAASPDGFNKTVNNEGADGSSSLSRTGGSGWDDDEY